MKETLYFLVICLLVVNAMLNADYTPIDEICVDISGNQIRPAIDGDLVVWEDGYDIYRLSLSDPNRIQHPIVVGGVQDFASVSGQYIVWRDKNTDYDIGIYDIVSGADWVLSSNDGATQRYPEVSAGTIICEDDSGGLYNVAVYDDLADAFVRIAPVSALQTNLAIDGSIAVWRDDRDGKKQIYLCDLSVTPYAPRIINASNSEQWYPAISDNLVVWEDHAKDPDIDLVAWSISAEAVVWVCEDAGVQSCPAISGGIIVWQDKPDGQADYDIRGYDFNTGCWLEIATGDNDDRVPVISGRTVVWQRNGTDIVGVTIPSPTVIGVDAPAAGQMFLAGTGIDIAWQLESGMAPEAVDIRYSVDGGEPNDIAWDIPFSQYQYAWNPIPDVDSQQYRIHIYDSGDDSAAGVSGIFTIFQCDADLTADVTGDCFVGMADFAEMATQWLTCGNLYNANWCFE